jgi:APA family basic amino acid/polyamine antiporter
MTGRFSTFLTLLKVALLVFIGAGTFSYAYGHWSNFSLMNAGGTCEGVAVTGGGLAGFGAAMLGALWAYDGWNNLSYVAGEVKHPERNLPLSFIAAMLTVMTLYIFANVGYFHVLTPTGIASVSENSSVAALASSKFLGSAAISFIAVALMISSFGALHASILGTSRLPYAMARDGLFFESVSRLSPRTHVPIRALVVTGIWSSLLAISGSYDTLTDYAIFAFWMFYGLITASVFIFRYKNPDAPRPYRTWGYPVVPAIFVLVTIALLVNTVMTERTQSLIGLGFVLLGLPVYWLFLRPKASKTTAN